MALRLDPLRLLVADDVGVGKTIEALLVARELLDRGEVKRLCVLCPPYLCEQWQKELAEKFNLEAVVVRSGTVGQLERLKTGPASVYGFYPIQVVSIDFVKSDRNRHAFLLDCPELVIVDEAHGSAVVDPRNAGQHERHELVTALAASPERHLILLTATPHSGLEGSFRSLLGLLRPEFAAWNIAELTEEQRGELARHFVQRTRRDIETAWEGQHCFPKRDPSDETYQLSGRYRELFAKTYAFCSELVRTGQRLEKRQQRVRYWAALALLRCVMSSPGAALAALESRHSALSGAEDEPDFRALVFESAEDRTDDSQPTPAVASAEATLSEPDRRPLRELGRLAATLCHAPDDTKLGRCAQIVGGLLRDGFQPIVWCRYIATADYVAEGLRRALQGEIDGLRVVAITGMLNDDERRTKVAELAEEPRRVLVATDCLSEGINLQDSFNAALHYDLPWNPNRLEQREGRVDRYGQRAPKVKTIRYFSPDSAVDGVVLRVLLDKAREIYRTLGTHVPVPEESESVTQAVLNALFMRGQPGETAATQLELGLEVPQVVDFHRQWDRDAAREKLNRTRFAQRALKPDEVRRELEAADAVLGDPEAVRQFVLNAAQRVGLPITRDRRPGVYRISIGPEVRATLPDVITFTLPQSRSGPWLVSFVSPTPEGAEYLGRNHRLVAALAQFLIENALTEGGGAYAARCGVIRARAVARLTTLYLLRVRYLVQQPGCPSLLSEEVRVLGQRATTAQRDGEWLADEDALQLLGEAQPATNVPIAERRELLTTALATWGALQAQVHERVKARAGELERSHRRVRQGVALRVRNLRVEPQVPPDLLGLLVLQPMV